MIKRPVVLKPEQILTSKQRRKKPAKGNRVQGKALPHREGHHSWPASPDFLVSGHPINEKLREQHATIDGLGRSCRGATPICSSLSRRQVASTGSNDGGREER